MDYPWNDHILIQAAPEDEDTNINEPVDSDPDEDTGTNEPVSTDEDASDENLEDQPDPSLAEDLTAPDSTDDFKNEIEDLKKQIEDLNKKYNLENEVEILKRRVDRVIVPDKADTNDDIFQSSSREVNYLKRAIRRFIASYKIAGLTSTQQQRIILELEQMPHQSYQDISAKLSKEINAKQQDIFDFIRNTDYRFRHRHNRESSVIDWKSI